MAAFLPPPTWDPLLISKQSNLINSESIKATDVCQLILQHLQVGEVKGQRSKVKG